MSVLSMTIAMLIGLIFFIFSGYYVFAVLGGLALISGYLFWGEAVVNLLSLSAFGTLKNYTMLAVPLFVFMGNMIERSGIAEKLFHSLSIILGRLRGGLAVSALIISIVFAASTGIVGAAVVTMGLLFLPAMLKQGYNKEMATGVICAGGTLGILIPPSIMIIVYGPAAGLSVGQLFYASLIPGVILGASYIVYVVVRSYINKDFAPPLPDEELAKYTWKDKILGLLHIIPVLLVVLSVLGAIWFGIAPPTEAAAVGAFAATIIAAAYGKLNFKVLKETLYNTIQTSTMIYMIMIFAAFLVGVFMRIGGGEVVENALLGLPFGKWGIFVIMMIIVFVLGFLMDWIASLLIIVPIFTPLAATLGFDPIWFAGMVLIMYQTSFLTPPFAYSIFYLKGIAPKGVETSHIMRGVIPFVLLQFLVLILAAIFPEIITWLPEKLIEK
jgi:tripartite ATP-independent transporter DctM subunit